MGKQMKIGLWGKGIYRTKDGHLRFSSPKELRAQYVHRVVFKRMVEETHPLTLAVLPEEYLAGIYEVHHIDFSKTNNQPDNLLGLSTEFHALITSYARRRDDGTFSSKFIPKFRAQRELFNEVPF